MTPLTQLADREGEWIPWAGGECPVDEDACVEVRYRGPPLEDEYAIYSASGGLFQWYHDGENDDIIAYRVVQS